MELLFGGLLLIFLGMLLGAAWTTQATQSRISRLAKERRRMNEEWAAIRAARQQQTEPTHRSSPLSNRNWYLSSTGVEERTDNDYAVGQPIG